MKKIDTLTEEEKEFRDRCALAYVMSNADNDDYGQQHLARHAYELADEMLKARES